MNELIPSVPALVKNVLDGMPFFMPEVALVITFVLVILADLFAGGKKSSTAFWLTIAGILTSLTLTSLSQGNGRLNLFENTLVLDNLAIVFKQLFAGIVILFAIFIRYNSGIQQSNKGPGDLYMLLPATLLGLNLMAMSSSLLMIYLSVEMISLTSYLMVGYVSADKKQTEAAMKYVLFGSVCSAVMLYGMSLLYAFTGTLAITDPHFIKGLSLMPDAVSALAIVMVLAGIGFKLSFFPLHFWSPDIYEGAPTPVTAFLSTGPKLAGFAVLIRFMEPFNGSQGYPVFDFGAALSAVAILSMIFGNFAAIWQNNVKRMLAYSAIGHTGVILMAIVVNSDGGLRAMLFYLLIYAVMNMAAFMLVDKIENQTGAINIKDYKGLGKHLRLEMVCFVVILVSLIGLPPLAGFIAKFLVFSAVFESYSSSGSLWMLALLITAVLTTVVSLFYYFRIPLYAFLRSGDTALTVHPKRDIISYVIVFLTGLVVLWGIFPGFLM